MVRRLTPSAVATPSADRYGPYPSGGVAALFLVALMTPMESRDTEFVFLNSWAAREAAESPLFRRELDGYRRLIRVDHPRAGGRGVDYTVDGLEQLVTAGREHPASRPRAHRNTDLPTDDGNRWALAYYRVIASARTLTRPFESQPKAETLI